MEISKDEKKRAADERAREKRTLTEGPVGKKLIMFALPMLFSSFLSQMYNVIDSIVCGQFVSTEALAAVGSCFTISMVMNAVFAGLGMGASILASQYFGAKDHDMVAKTMITAFAIGLIISGTMTVLGIIFANPILRIVDTPADIYDLAYTYLVITFIGAIGHIFYAMGNALLRGIGDSKAPMIFIIITTFLNLFLNLAFVLIFDWGIAGIAWATVIGQWVSAILIFIRVAKGTYGFKITKQNFKISGVVVKQLAKLSVPSALQGLATSIGGVVLQKYTNGFGSSVVAANTIIVKVDSFMLVPIVGIGQAIMTFVGQNLAAGKEDRVRKGFRLVIIYSVVFTILAGVLIYFAGSYGIRIFTSDQEVIAVGAVGLQLMAFSYLFTGMYQNFTGIERGAGAATPVMLMSFLSILIQIPLTRYMAVVRQDWTGIYSAQIILAIINMCVSGAYYKFGNWQKYVVARRAK